MIPSISLTKALRNYRQQLDRPTLDTPMAKEEVIAILQARAAIATLLNPSDPVIAPKKLTRKQRIALFFWDLEKRGWIKSVSNELKAEIRGEVKTGIVRRSSLSQSTLAALSPRSPWWDRFNSLASSITVAGLVGSTAIIVDMSSKFLIPGVDVFGIFSIVLGSFISWLTGNGLVTQNGQSKLKGIAIRLGFGSYLWHELGAILSLGLLTTLGLVVLILYPSFSNRYLAKAEDEFLKGRFAIAKADLQRSLLFDPDNQTAKYQLGKVYRQFDDNENAKKIYQEVVGAKPPIYADDKDQIIYLRAANELGRLLIMAKKSKEASIILDRAIGQINNIKVTKDDIEEIQKIKKNINPNQPSSEEEYEKRVQALLIDRNWSQKTLDFYIKFRKKEQISKINKKRIALEYTRLKYLSYEALGWSALESELFIKSKETLEFAIRQEEKRPVSLSNLFNQCLTFQIEIPDDDPNADQKISISRNNSSLSECKQDWLNVGAISNCLLTRLFKETKQLKLASETRSRCKDAGSFYPGLKPLIKSEEKFLKPEEKLLSSEENFLKEMSWQEIKEEDY